jgi:hypothetical protein
MKASSFLLSKNPLADLAQPVRIDPPDADERRRYLKAKFTSRYRQ